MSRRKSLGGGGRFVRPESQNFDIIINILIGIRRSLSNLVEIPGKKLDEWQFNKRLSSENEWVSGAGQTKKTSK